MANSILTPTMVTRKALTILHEKLGFVGTLNKQYDDQYAGKGGAKIGSTLQIRKPNEYTVRTGATLSAQDTTESSVALTLATQKGVDVNFTSVELTMNLDDFSERVLDPAMSVLAANIQNDVVAGLTPQVAAIVGTPGTTPANLLPFLQARAKLNQGLAPKDNNRFAMIDSVTMASMVNGLSTVFNDGKSIASQYLDGVIGHAASLDFIECEMAYAQTNGTRTNATPLVNGASQSGATINTDGFGASVTVKKGDVFTIAGVFDVHPETKQAYSHLKQFVVTADATASAGVINGLAISPSIVTSGASQNVSAGPADNAALTFFSANASDVATQNLVYHRDFAAFVTADLEMPQGVDFAARETFDGISLRVVRAYDINNDKFPCRIDVLYGYGMLRQGFACRVTR